MIQLIKRAWSQDRGAALAVIATTLFLLMGVAAISADLAWYYLNASRVQRAADAAALAGVVHLPQQPGDADTTALDIANRNGYDNAAAGTSVTPDDISAFQLQVRISTEVDTFFAKILGWDQMTIARTAVAEYIPPLRLGSPTNQFGNSCAPEQAGCTGQPNFWANIHGYWTDTVSGDAYSSHCAVGEGNDDPSCVRNAGDHETGYLYGIESPESFTVEFNDLEFRNIFLGSECPHNEQEHDPFPEGCTSDWTRTGDRGCEAWGNDEVDCGPTMYVALYAPDATPLVIDSAPICEATVPPLPQVGEAVTYTWQTPEAIPGASSGPTSGCWTQMPGTGIHILQVKVLEPPLGAANSAGFNRYSVRSTTGNLFGVGDFALYNNVDSSATTFYLAEVPAFYNGKTFVVELWDAGDAQGDGTLAVIDPPTDTPTPFDDGECRIYRKPPNPDASWTRITTIDAGSPCQKSITPQQHNGEWLKFELDLPPTYSCTDCWWQMQYNYPGGVNDTTTWRAYMIGNPIHLID